MTMTHHRTSSAVHALLMVAFVLTNGCYTNIMPSVSATTTTNPGISTAFVTAWTSTPPPSSTISSSSSSSISGGIVSSRKIPHRITSNASSTQLYGLFDRFQSGGSGSSKESLDEQWEAQQRILQLRNKSPQERQKYFDEIEKRREEASKKQKDMWSWQTKKYEKGEDPIDEWKKRRADGTISDLENQYGDPKKVGGIPIPGASFGVGGEFGVWGKFDNGGRFDLRLPYADQGYVDEDADVMGKIGKFFSGGGGKKDNKVPVSNTKSSISGKNSVKKVPEKKSVAMSNQKEANVPKKNKWPWEK